LRFKRGKHDEDDMQASHAMIHQPEPETAYSGAALVCEALLAHGVDTVFGYAGGAILHFYDALHRTPGLRHVTVRHEQAAAHAASGYARAGGGVGVCVATSGPGATNLLTGIMDAHLDSTPLVVLCGQVSTALLGRDAFQETDMLAMSAPITKHGFQPRRVDDVEPMLHAAFHLAASGRPGPVLIDLPKDVLTATTTARRPAPLPMPGYRMAPAPDADAIARAVALLAEAERPLLLVGGGALIAEAGPALTALAERLALPIVSTINAKGLISEHHPQSLGMIGMYGRKAAVHALRECDVLLAVGCRFTDRITGPVDAFARGKRIVHLDVDAYELGKNVPVAVAIQSDGRQGANALLAATAGRGATPAQRRWARGLAAARAICERCVPHAAPSGVHPRLVMEILDSLKAPSDVVTTGVGQHQMFACHFLHHERPRTFITSSGAGTMGYGLPAAIGAAAARPDARVFVVDGDGSFQMTAQELATLAQENLPVVVVLLDNAQLGMVRQWQDRVYEGRHAAVRFDARAGHPDFLLLARAYGVPAFDVATPDALAPALDAAIARRGPALVRVAVDPTVDNQPMMPAGEAYASFAGLCVPRPGVLFTAAEAAQMEEASR